MWTLLYYVKADQAGWEPSYCVDQVLLPLFAAKPALGRSVSEVAVQCKRSEAEHYQRVALPTGTSPWTEVGKYWSGCRRFRLGEVASLDEVTRLSPYAVRDMVAPSEIADFVSWSVPAEGHAALVLWGHGGSWRVVLLNALLDLKLPKDAFDTFEMRLQERPADEALTELLKLPELADKRYLAELATPTVTPLHGLPDLARGLRTGLARVGRSSLDILGFNSCFMACIESAYEFRNQAKYLVASEEETPFEGWRHEAWIRDLEARPGTDPEGLARILVSSYQAGSRAATTISAVRLGDCMDRLTGRIRRFVEATRGVDPAAWRLLREARLHVDAYGRYGQSSDVLMVDIVRLFHEIEVACPALADVARDVSHECLSAVVAADAGPARRGRYGSHGLSIFFPETREEFQGLANKDRYAPGNAAAPSFVADSGWRGFLDDYWREAYR